MFERSRLDNVPEANAVPVEITLTDGTVTKGKLFVMASKTAADLLNGSCNFVEFEPYGGERSFLAKALLASVKLAGVPRGPNLGARLRDPDGFDPHAILGVAPGADKDEVRRAYVGLAKNYHPDRYATAELPDEVRRYLSDMARRINAAYAALDVPERKQAARAQPIFTHAGR
jgi:DnaJ domain